ncbi:MAG: hypothetical protein AAF384_04370 [Pseudomonadota bacterium]
MANKVDWKILRGSLVVFIGCLVIAGGLVGGSFYFKSKMDREYRVHHSNFRAASQQYLAVDEEERIIEEYYPEFVRLYNGGFLGPERRLDWLESLRNAGKSLGLPELTYKMSPQKVEEPEFDLNLGTYDLNVSTMSLSMGLLHEGDFSRLLAAIDREAPGVYSVAECQFQLTRDDGALNPTTPNIAAACIFDWWTIDLRGEARLQL